MSRRVEAELGTESSTRDQVMNGNRFRNDEELSMGSRERERKDT